MSKLQTNFTIHSKILDEIISPQEYNRLESEIKIPYDVEFVKADQRMILIGTQHSLNASDPQFDHIQSLFRKFVRLQPRKNTLAAVESFIPPLLKSKKDMIKKYGESGLVTYLANKSNLKTFCPEPRWNEIIDYALRSTPFNKEDIALWAFINGLTWILKNDNISAKILLEKVLSQLSNVIRYFKLKKATPQYYFSRFSSRLYNLTGKYLLPNQLDELDKRKINIKEIKQIQSPFIKKTLLNDIGAVINSTRDRFIALHLLQKLIKGKSIFAVFGINHVVLQLPIFKKFFMEKAHHLSK